MPNNISVGVGLYIFNDKDEVLLLKRIGKHGGETWCPPGGHIEYWETSLQAAKREVKEEAGLDIEIKDMTTELVTEDFHDKEKKHGITFHIITKKYQGIPKIMETEKCSKIGWFNTNNLPTPLFLPVKTFLKHKTSKDILENK